MKNSLLIVILLVSLNSRATVCSRTHCQNGRQPTSVCVVDGKAIDQSPLWRASSIQACGYQTEKYIVDSTDDIQKVFDLFEKSCRSLDRLTIDGHGVDGRQFTGDLTYKTIQNLKDYSCLFNAGAEIQFMGCSVGKSCAGDMLLYQTAKALLAKGGTVTAPTTAASTLIPGITPVLSLNGKTRVLNYQPGKKPHVVWAFSGLTMSGHITMNQRCSEELLDLMKNYSAAKAEAEARGCRENFDTIRSGRIQEYQDLELGLRKSPFEYADSTKWGEMERALYTLKKVTDRYDSCQPSTGGGSATPSEDVTQ